LLWAKSSGAKRKKLTIKKRKNKRFIFFWLLTLFYYNIGKVLGQQESRN